MDKKQAILELLKANAKEIDFCKDKKHKKQLETSRRDLVLRLGEEWLKENL